MIQRTPLWSRRKVVASYTEGPVFIPGWVSFLVEGFFEVFTQLQEKRQKIQATFIFGYQMTIIDRPMGGSPGKLSEELVTQEKRKKGWGMNCDVDEATEGLENEL